MLDRAVAKRRNRIRMGHAGAIFGALDQQDWTVPGARFIAGPIIWRDMMIRGTILPATAVLFAAQAVAQMPDPARAPVQSLDDGLIAIMKGGKKLGLAGREAQLAPIIDRVFDLPLMIRLAVGPAWTQASPADRAALLAAFRRLTITEYARNFDGWNGHVFTIDEKIEARGGDRLVRTTLTAPRESPANIAYRLRQSGSEWRVIDVFYNNAISQLTTRRADFESSLRSGGARALIAHINTLADKGMR